MQDKQLQPDAASSAAHFVTIAGWLLSVLPLQTLFDTGHAMVEDADDDDAESMPSISAQQSGIRAFLLQSCTLCQLGWHIHCSHMQTGGHELSNKLLTQVPAGCRCTASECPTAAHLVISSASGVLDRGSCPETAHIHPTAYDTSNSSSSSIL